MTLEEGHSSLCVVALGRALHWGRVAMAEVSTLLFATKDLVGPVGTRGQLRVDKMV